MNWLEALILGIVQGLTEFLPVSSSGHLTIGQTLLGIEFAEGDMLLFDVLVHAATVLSTIVVLWSQVADLMKGTFCTTKWNSEKEYVAKICVSMIPVFIVGMFFKDYVEQIFGSGLMVVGVCLLITACLLAKRRYLVVGLVHHRYRPSLCRIAGSVALRYDYCDGNFAGQQERRSGSVQFPHGAGSHTGRGFPQPVGHLAGRSCKFAVTAGDGGRFCGCFPDRLLRLQGDDRYRQAAETDLL